MSYNQDVLLHFMNFKGFNIKLVFHFNNTQNGQGFTRPNADQLKGIASLVAAAVRGLTPNKVVIVDQEGNCLKPMSQ